MAKRKPTRKKVRKTKKKSRKGWWLVLLLVLGLGGFAAFYYTSRKMVQTATHFHEIVPKGYKSVGLDISHHQGEIDWEELLENKGFDTIIDFVYCKATEGSDHLDTQFQRNREFLNLYGIQNGAYHYLNPKSAPRPQADHFLATYQYRSIDLPPVLDVEDEGFSDEDLLAKVKIYGDEIYQKIGVRPIIYTSLHFYETKFRGKLDGYKFWIAAYSQEPQDMLDREVLHWQFSESGRLPGIKKKVDLNVSKVAFE